MLGRRIIPHRRAQNSTSPAALREARAAKHSAQVGAGRSEGAPSPSGPQGAAACTIGTFTHVVCNFYMVAYCSSAGLGLLMIGKTTDKSMNSVPTSSRCICFQVSVLKFVCVRVINFWLAMPAACTVLLLKIAFSANRLVSIV